MKKHYDIVLRGHHLRLLYEFYYSGKEGQIRTKLIEDYSQEYAENTIKILEKIAYSKVKVKLIDTIDDICQACNDKDTEYCKGKFTSSADRFYLGHFKLKIDRVYPSRHILKKIHVCK